ncbi:MAG: hypothetical protein KAJ29_07745, partial [Alphaproteobacteria bacterium]|nr:hypothetical protein [Alphaproteobacteria bacterium]
QEDAQLKLDQERQAQQIADAARTSDMYVTPKEPEPELVSDIEQNAKQEDYNIAMSGAGEDRVAGTMEAGVQKQAKQKEEEERKTEQVTRAALAVTTAQAMRMLDELDDMHEELDNKIENLENRSDYVNAKVDNAIEKLDALQGETIKSIGDVDYGVDIVDSIKNKYDTVDTISSMEKVKDALKNKLEKNQEKIEEFKAEKLETLEEQKDLSISIQEKGTPVSEEDLQSMIEIKQKLEDLDSDITQHENEQMQLVESVDYIVEVNSDPKLSSEDRMKLNDALTLTLDDTADKQTLTFKEANTLAIVTANITERLEQGNTPEPLCTIAAAETTVSGETAVDNDTPDALSAVAAVGGTISSETAVEGNTDTSGLEEPAPETSEEEMVVMDAVQGQLEGGTISREDIATVYAETGASDEVIAKVEADKSVTIEEPEEETAPGIKGVVANEVGTENANIMGGVALAAFPFLAFS